MRFFFRRRAGEVQPDRVDARDVLADVRVDIVHADQKGALILATVGLVFGVVLAAGFEGRLDVGGSWTGLDSAATWGSLSWWLGVCSAAVACGFAGHPYGRDIVRRGGSLRRSTTGVMSPGTQA